jgi:hypothetical protein
MRELFPGLAIQIGGGLALPPNLLSQAFGQSLRPLRATS